MSEDPGSIKPLTRAEANALLPRVRSGLQKLRSMRDRVPKLQVQAEIEDLTGRDEGGTLRLESKKTVEGILGELKGLSLEFQRELDELTRLGARLKDLDQGLVDFYGRVDGEVVFLCWKDGEDEVGWYHPLDGGYRQRKPLEG